MKKHLSPLDFTIPSYSEIAQKLLGFTHDSFVISQFTQNFPAALNAVVDELCLYDIGADKDDSTQEEREKSFEKTVLDLKKLSLKHALTSGNTTDPVLLQEIAQHLAQVEKALRVM